VCFLNLAGDGGEVLAGLDMFCVATGGRTGAGTVIGELVWCRNDGGTADSINGELFVEPLGWPWPREAKEAI
jgi:hypothetical protein